jgi:hypothetical protein
MSEFVARAKDLAAALAGLDDLDVRPSPPHGAMFHVFVRRELERLNDAALDIAEQTKTFLGYFFPTEVPGVQATELTIGGGSVEVPVEEARELYAELLRVSA